jgi:DNA-binding transcriptional LysR family regulator
LFDRSGRSVRPSEAGAAVLPLARAALSAVAAIGAVADELRGVLRGHIAVGMMTSCPPDVITGTLAAFHDKHPGVDITLIEAPSADLLADLRDGAIDLAVIGFASPPGRGIHAEIINDDVLVAAVERHHALATRTSMSLRALVDHDLICLPRGSGIRAGLDEGCAAARVQARVALEASNPEVVAGLAALGLGVAVLPESYARTRDDLHLMRLSRPTLRARVGVAWRADGRLSPAASALVTLWQHRQR